MNAATAAVLAFAVAVGVTPSDARDSALRSCKWTNSWTIPGNQPVVLNDPRSGLSLHLDADGRHMTAISRDGRIVWQRNLFADPRLEHEMGPPPILLFGDPPVSAVKWRRHVRDYVAKLYIDRIGIVSTCGAYLIDRSHGPLLAKHYIIAGSGTRLNYLLDAKTGDFMVSDIN